MSRPRPTALVNAFDRLMVDGQDLDAKAVVAHFEQRASEQDNGTGNWTNSLLGTVVELIGQGSLSAMTSGTTGPPKAYTIPQEDLVNSARLTGKTFGLVPGDRVLLCLPSDFVAGKMMLVRAFALRLDLHIIDPRGSVLDNLKVRDRFRFAAMVPLQLHRAIQEDKVRLEQQFGTILLGGGPVSEALLEDIRDLDVQVYQSYGSTETVTHVALRRLNGPEATDSYHALGDVHFARDPRGCLVVYTPHLSTKQHLTNDLVELLDDTHFRWLGRHDNVILSGGKKIFPEQLEAKTAGILPFPHYFTAVPDEVLGQAVMLVLETERPQEEVLPEVLERIMEYLPPHEWPRRVQALKKIERTNSGKVIRR